MTHPGSEERLAGVSRYVKQPKRVDAIQWTGRNRRAIKAFLGPRWEGTMGVSDGNMLRVNSSHGVPVGGYVLRGVNRNDEGTYWTLPQMEFEGTYERA